MITRVYIQNIHTQTQTLIQELVPDFSTRVHDTYPLYVPAAPAIPQKLAFHITPGAQRVPKDHPTHGSKHYDGCSLASGIDADCGGLADYLLRNSK
jgi:hypothetical protein